MANLENFIFNSDYSTDKIAFTKSGEYTTVGPASLVPKYEFINTHIKTQLYVEGDYKIDGSNDVYPMTWETPDPRASASTFMYNGECWIVIFYYVRNSSSIGKTIKYRLWAYYGEKDAKNTDITPTANIAPTSFIFTSDKNYPRFINDGYIALGQSYTHSLGYIPFAKIWLCYPQQPIPDPNGGAGTITSDIYTQQYMAYFGDMSQITTFITQVIQISDSQIITYSNSSPDAATGAYFRIYVL